jgi:HD-GYP domain-containing protein (c-di-GMP phosphodiesterase class II)
MMRKVLIRVRRSESIRPRAVEFQVDACLPPPQALYSRTGADPTTATIIERLKELSFFSDIPEHDLGQIAEIMVEKSYRKGAVIIEERTEAERFFIIYRGKIEITKKFEGDEEFVLSVQSDGDFFGEMALLDEQPRSATARAIEPTIVLETSRKNFETLLYKAPMLAYRIMRELSSRLRETGALLVSHLQQRNRQLYRSHIDTISVVVQAIEKRAAQTSGRTRRVASIAKAIGKEMGLEDEQLMVLELSALLHDLGMLAVPESVLAKPGPLAERELGTIRKHPQIGKEMIEDVPFLKKTVPEIFHHHEKFNGTGYPKGLSGTSIPLASRILAVVDAFEAMTNGTPYRHRLSVESAIEEIRKAAGSQFDPDVVAALEKLGSTGELPAS